jgi:hypothetical protein
MNFNDLKQRIEKRYTGFRQNAVTAVISYPTIQNWLTGFYIIEFEQKNEDYAKYEASVLQTLQKRLRKIDLTS